MSANPTLDLAALLNGREYPFRLSKEEAAQAKADGLVVVYGASDDLMEFEGAIYDELSAYKGATAHLTHEGLLHNECENDECPSFKKLKSASATIKALWCKEEGYSWTFETEIRHETFEIVEEGEKYCRGIVFNLKDVEP